MSGQINEVHFLNRSELRVCDAAGVYGFKYQYDDIGRITHIYYCDLYGNALGGKKYQYKDSEIAEIVWLDSEGEPMNNFSLYAYIKRELDENGNCVKVTFLDENQKNVLTSMGYASVTYKFDEYGHCSMMRFYDESGAMLQKNNEVAIISYEYDARGNIICEKYFDSSEKPIQNANGYYGIAYQYVDKLLLMENVLVEKQYLNAEGNPASDNTGISKIKLDYMNNFEFYDITGNLTYTPEGYAKISQEVGLPSLGSKITSLKYTVGYDINGSRINNIYGFAYVLRGYDDYDRIMLEAFYDRNDQLVIGPKGYAMVRYTYDLLDNLTKIEYMENDTVYANGPEGFSKFISNYNSANLLTDIAYYDKNDHLVFGAYGFARLTIMYNANNLEVGRSYYGDNGELYIGPEGYAESQTEYTKEKIITQFYDVDGKLINNIYGYAITEVSVIEGGINQYYDMNGVLIKMK